MSAYSFYSERRPDVIRARGRVNTDALYRQTRAEGTDVAGGRFAVKHDDQPVTMRIGASDLYLDAGPATSRLIRTLLQLGQAIGHAQNSIDALSESDPMGADLHVQQLRPLLRKLFMNRTIGDGFGATVDAMMAALDNNRGQPLEEGQIEVLRRTLVALRDEPFVAFRKAMTLIEDIERAGFSTEPPGFEQLADWLTA